MRSGWVCVRNVLETPIFSQIYDTYRTVKAGWRGSYGSTNSGCEWNSVGDPNSRIHSSAGGSPPDNIYDSMPGHARAVLQSVGVLRAALRVQCWSPSQATPPTTTIQQRRQGATVRRANQQDQCLTPTRCRAVRCPAVRATADVAVPAGSARERPLRLLFHGVCGPGRARGARRVGVGGCV